MLGFSAFAEDALAEAPVYTPTVAKIQPVQVPPQQIVGLELQYWDHESYPLLSQTLIKIKRYG